MNPRPRLIFNDDANYCNADARVRRRYCGFICSALRLSSSAFLSSALMGVDIDCPWLAAPAGPLPGGFIISELRLASSAFRSASLIGVEVPWFVAPDGAVLGGFIISELRLISSAFLAASSCATAPPAITIKHVDRTAILIFLISSPFV